MKLITFTLPNPLVEAFKTSNMPEKFRPMFNFGEYNGYVAVPKEHPCYGLDMNQIEQHYDISVHGGITFADSDIIGQPQETEGMWIIGFDTSHAYSTKTAWTQETVLAEANELKKQLEKI